MPARRRRCVRATVGALVALLAACGTPDPEIAPVGAPADPTSTTVDAATTESTVPAPETTAAPNTVAATELPGEPVDGLIAGTPAQIAGVAWNETFEIRSLPGDGQPPAASLPPLTELTLTGEGRELETGSSTIVWAEVTAEITADEAADQVTGWVTWWSLVYVGARRDLTADAIAAFGQPPTAPTALELGELVTDELAPVDPSSAGARLVRASDPGTDPTVTIVYDHFPGEAFGDDAANGSRLWIVARQIPAGDLPASAFGSAVVYELVSIEAASLCSRGVDAAGGVCV